MPILRLIGKIRNVLPFRAENSIKQRKFSLTELQELSERDDFGEILTAAGVPDKPISEVARKNWSDGKEFDASKLDDAAFKKYEKDDFKK